MNKIHKRLVSILLVALLAAGNTVMPVSAARHDHYDSIESYVTESNRINGSNVKAFTSTSDLIKDTIKDLLGNSDVTESVTNTDDALAEMAEEKSGRSFSEVLGTIGMAFFDNREEGYIETEKFNFNEDEMRQVLERALSRFYLNDKVVYELDMNGDVVAGIEFGLPEAFSVALDDIDKNTEEAGGTAVVVEETSEPALMMYASRAVLLAEEEPEPEPAPTHNYTAEFNWSQAYVENDSDVDGDGVVDPTLVYAPNYDPETNNYGIDPATYHPGYHIGVSMNRKLSWSCMQATLTCSDCSETKTVEVTQGMNYDDGKGGTSFYQDPIYLAAKEIPIDNDGTMQNMLLALDNPMPADGDPQMIGVIGPILDNPEHMDSTTLALLPYVNCYVLPVSYEVDGNSVTEFVNISAMNLSIHYSELSSFNADHEDYYGVSAPYWTDKNTAATPLGALKSLCNMDINEYVPDGNMDMMAEMLCQAFISYVYQYGDMLLAMLKDAKEAVADENLTDVQKMLILHDWLAKNASFDMYSLIAQKSGESSGSDPITMTPFGTLLSSQLGTNGAVCLGYAATYLYLIQNVFEDNYKADGEWLSPLEADHIVDFVQIRFHADVAESSVAGGDSGFGTDAIFNEPHYFNAVRLSSDEHGLRNSSDVPLDRNDNCWYYTDACYDDISVEVISQYRVETDGNISHMYMLNSPQTFVAQFEDNCDYFDSAYDGLSYYKTEEIGEDNLPIWGYEETSNEIAYNDEQFEQTWFSNVVSEIVYDDENWYYVEGQANSYSSMKDMFENENGDMEFDGDMMEIMKAFQDDADSADKLKYRPRYNANGAVIGDIPAPVDEDNSYEDSSGNSFSMDTYEDTYAVVMFHYGYGEAGPEKEEYPNNYEGAFYSLVEEDNAYNALYPDLNHSMGVYDTDGDGAFDKIYFNLSNRIMVYDLEGEYASEDERITQLKEYNVVEAYTNGKPFTGMSFYTEGSPVTQVKDYSFTVTDHPISSISINDFIYWTDANGDGYIDTRNSMPVMYVSIGTDYSNSYTVEIDGEKVPYQKEAVNFNPDYYRFMDEDPNDGENTNTEFMWCANVVDAMPMEGILGELASGEKVEVTVEATCGERSFTESRTGTYGLSDGTTKANATEKNDRLGHHYFEDDAEDGYVCFRCNQYRTYEEVDDEDFNEYALHKNCTQDAEKAWNWSDDNSECTHVIMNCSVEDCPENKVHECEVNAVADETTGGTTYIATCKVCDETSEGVVHTHTYGEPVYKWSEDYSTCTATFTCEPCEEGADGNVVTLTCEGDDVTSETAEDGTTTYTATFTFNGETYTATVVVSPECEHGTMKNTPAKAATCAEAGNVEYWTCDKCGNNYADEAGTELLYDVVLPIDPEKHTGETEVIGKKEATETEAGYTGDTYCLGCDALLEEGTEIPTLEHVHGTMTKTSAKAATCAAEGNVEYWTCDKCGSNYADEAGTELLDDVVLPIDPEKHTGETAVKDKKEETETEEGYTGDIYCVGCNTVLEKGTVIPVVEAEKVLISVSEVHGKVGTSVEMFVSIDKIPDEGIAILKLELDYDTEKLELVSAEDCGILGAYQFDDSVEDIPYLMVWENLENYHNEGNLIILTFNILAEASGGDSAIKLTCSACGNVDEEIYDVTVSDGSVKILVPGDVNGDGVVDLFDVLRLRKYVAGWDVEIYEEVSNVDGEEGIDSFDVLRLRKFVAGWDVELN